MEFVKLVVKLGNHLLDVCTFIVDIDFRKDSFLQFLLVDKPLRNISGKWFLDYHVFDLNLIVLCIMPQESLVQFLHELVKGSNLVSASIKLRVVLPRYFNIDAVHHLLAVLLHLLILGQWHSQRLGCLS